jgi:ferrous iron transport protein A
MLPLFLAKPEEENTIKKVSGNPEVKRHLEDMGFSVGSFVTVISTNSGNVIVKVKESRVAISEEMAMKIYV